jgi:cysteine desulfurase
MDFLRKEFGNAGSRTHEYGLRAKRATQEAREQVARVVDAGADEVVFSSGATESNNLAILGLEKFGDDTHRRHIISTEIEHKAVLEPLGVLADRGFEVTLIPPTTGGWVEADAIRDALRPDTVLVSVMHANNETGVMQPIKEIAQVLETSDTIFHIDAAQGFGKDIPALQNPRIDLISVSGHKIYGPKGVGALITRRRGYKRLPLAPLMFGGGQEHGLRPGTLPVQLIVGLGLAAELALEESETRQRVCADYRMQALEALSPLEPDFNGDQARVQPHVMNLSWKGLDSEALMVALKDLVAISNGSACTSQSYEPSHVLKAMRLPDDQAKGAVRISWSHMTEGPDWVDVAARIRSLQ